MNPSGLLRLVLPGIAFSFGTRVGGRHEQHAGMLTTVYVATEALKLRMVWQSTQVAEDIKGKCYDIKCSICGIKLGDFLLVRGGLPWRKRK